MMKNFSIILVWILIAGYGLAQSDLRVNISLGTVIADDPYCDESFVAGYESVGGIWTGSQSTLEYQSVSNLYDTSHYNDYDILTYNSLPGNELFRYSTNSSKGLLYVLPSGSNFYKDKTYEYTHPVDPVICGSGYNSNITGYGCEFWDRDPFGYNDTILTVIQGGTQFAITGISRLSSTQIRITIAGNDSNEARFEHGVPIRISGLSGTDISPLPSGLYYLSYGSNHNLYFDFTTSSGTIGTLQTPSSGTFKYGTNDSYAFFRTSSFNLFFPNLGYTIYGVNGFSNNPNGEYGITNWVNIDGYGDKFELIHNLGTGAYTGGGHTSFNSQSYSTPYIAGKLSFIRDSISHLYSRECTWWEARYRARMTASGGGVYDSISGYGRIDVLKAINYKGKIPADPYNILGNIGKVSVARDGETLKLNFPSVLNASRYVLYNNQELLREFSAHSVLQGMYYELKYSDRRNPSQFWYVAYRNQYRSEESEKVIVPYNYYRKIKVKRK